MTQAKSYSDKATPIIDKFLKDVMPEWTNGREFDFESFAHLLITDLNLRLLFGFDASLGELKQISNAACFIEFNMRNMLPSWVPSPKGVRFKRSGLLMRQLMRDILSSSSASEGSFVAHLRARAVHEEEDRLIDEMLSLYFGANVPGYVLAWSMHLLSNHHIEQELMHDELTKILGSALPSPGDISSLKFTNNVVKEVLRLFPVAWCLPRVSAKPVSLCDISFPENSVFLPLIYHLHRSPVLWQEPNRFNPDRFSERKSLAPFSYLPFGLGKRACIGKSMASIVLPQILASLLQRFSFQSTNLKTAPKWGFELHPANGVWVTASRRN